MHFFTVTALLASLATPTVYAAATTKSFVACSTGYGPKSTSSLKTVSKILTLPLTATRITVVIPKATVTPKTTVTSTSTATSTSSTTLTLPQSTSVFTETLTNSFFETKSETVTVFTTSTTLTTTTDTGGTTTVAASAGFVSIESSIPNSQKKRRAIAGKPVDARAEMGLVDRAAPKKYHLKFLPGGGVTVSPAFYPTAVGCGGFVAVITTKLITKTAAKTKTLTAPQPTSYVTSTSTEVTTATITPIVASTTVTEIASVRTKAPPPMQTY
ncbi:uncharacterized protein M421DRAFT_238222 [Didymella exigua CBS 183.55]|uniref:Uncharacterized protein n=1 Tax=Didymella exigua CBS 183.55 TaxID=1150837 RepID=A0A6A5RE78_9PLEO|nr:uncharacterized protein M421DRAFT_238222 [Didymella exigua CBS 183.55]KAF1925528.1 hypothetical protein M421DRAFT_238222 [Didymella exigua CBS 183.55]